MTTLSQLGVSSVFLMHLSADADLLADFTSYHNVLFLTYREGH